MRVTDLGLHGLKRIEPRCFPDSRGFFLETFNAPRYRQAGIDVTFVQDNHSRSTRGALRGFHYQSEPGQAKLLSVTRGRIFDVAVDIRPASPTFGRWEGLYLDSETHEQLFVPIGFAHGFCVVSDVADVQYKVSAVYEPATECSIRFDDPDIGVVWPIDDPVVSERDRNAESFAELRARLLAQGGKTRG
jgi:dTDP-4-dehydrorhamnose 3,5-epimerase